MTRDMRRERKAFLARAPAEVRALLADAPFLLPPESDAIEALLRFEPDGIGTEERILPPRYAYLTRRHATDARELLGRLTDAHDRAPAYLALDGHLPVFRVGFGAARRLLDRLWTVAEGHLYLVTETLDAGLAIDETLDADQEDGEIFYEIACWPTD